MGPMATAVEKLLKVLLVETEFPAFKMNLRSCPPSCGHIRYVAILFVSMYHMLHA